MKSLGEIIVTDIVGVHTIPTERGRRLIINKRSNYGLSFSRDRGKIIYVQHGKRFISEKNTAVLLPEGGTYSLHNEEGGDFPIINFSSKYPITDEILQIPISSVEGYLDSFEEMKSLILIPERRARAYSLLYSIFDRLSREDSREDDLLEGAMKHLSESISDPALSNASLAAASSISEVYFRRLFKARYGVTPKQYILSLRISMAKELLSSGGSVSSVAEKCGFSGVYQFSRCFREITGISPSEYAGKRKA